MRDEQRKVHLSIGGETAFEATPATCDTCHYLFTKLRPADSLKDAVDPDLVERIRGLLKDMREMPDELALGEVASVLERGRYTAALVSLVPQLTMPGDEHDYFAHEAVETWGLDPYYGAPHSPRTLYYRLGSTPLRNHRPWHACASTDSAGAKSSCSCGQATLACCAREKRDPRRSLLPRSMTAGQRCGRSSTPRSTAI